MSLNPDQIAALAGPLSPTHVKSRTQAGRQLSYIEAWHAISEANRIFGFDGWTRETVDLRQLGEPRLVGDKFRVGYAAKVRVTVTAGERVIVREGCGFGSGIDKDSDQAHESALKEAESDAMKRALMTFGNPFGLALYDKTQANVADGAPPPGPVAQLTAGNGRKSAAQAKRDGDDVTIKAEIAGLDRPGIAEWRANFDENTAHLPYSWLDSVRDMLEHRLEDLNGSARVAPEASEMDEAFRATVGARGPAPLAGHNGQSAAA